jgi:zinc protease
MKAIKFIIPALLIFAASCNNPERKENISINYTKYKLDNGLEVILHKDTSDPIVAVAILYHVGSARETPGKTGFAHLFEHVLFQESENIPQDQFFKKIQDAGGTLNGGTDYDYTVYYEVVPENALEKVLWMESDRMGFLLNTLTPSAFINQQNVVINEKRQRVDNQPYGETEYVINKNVYPEGHPYHWTVIGSMEDLKNASLEDVKNFYDSYYGPNNATLVIAGDFDSEDVRKMVDKYFAEIQARKPVEEREPVNVQINSTKKLVYEDNFAKQPELTMVWPTTEAYSEDSYPLLYLAEILAGNKKSSMYRHMVKDTNFTSNTTAYQNSLELAGTFNIVLDANEGYTLKDLEHGVLESLNIFEQEGITETDLERIKAGAEMEFYNSISGVLNKSFMLAQYNAYLGDPGYIEKEIKNIRSVTVADIMRVYEKYIKDKPYIATSFVPKGESWMAAEGSVPEVVPEEDIMNAFTVAPPTGAENEQVQKTPSKIDRSVEPALGPDPSVKLPKIWSSALSNGIKIYGIENKELPVVSFTLTIDGGFKADDINKTGVANMVTDLMLEGTATKKPEELEEEIDLLGANISAYTNLEEIVISGNTLARNFDKTIDLVKEILLEPRWDQEQFEIKKEQNINYLISYEAQPTFIASREFNRLVFGEDNIFGHYVLGTKESVSSITPEDLKDYYNRYFSPAISNFHIAGDISQKEVEKAMKGLESSWKAKDVELPVYKEPVQSPRAKIYFWDMPGSKQSVIYAGNISIGRDDPGFYAATVMNYQLGGSFNGILNMILREEKGYSYGANSGFTGRKGVGIFMATTSVQSNSTEESAAIIKSEIEKYRNGISQQDLTFTKNALLRSNTRRFETNGALVSMLQLISKYNFPFDYVKDEENTVRTMTVEKHRELAQKYLVPEKMTYLIVGDASTQKEKLKKLGLGDPVLLNGR